jgi:hypothetical protein
VVAVLGDQPPFTLQLVTLGGEVALTFALPNGYFPTAAGGDMVLLKNDAGQVTGLTRDGHLYDLGTVGASSPTGPLISADGTQWVYADEQWDQSTGIIHAKVWLGPLGRPGVVVDSADEQYRDLRPFSWTALGPAIEHGAVGIGGYILFNNATGPVDRVDPAALQATALKYDATGCGFSDLAADGRIACVSSGAAPVLKIFTDGQARTFALPQPRFRVAGAAYFNPTSSHQMVIGGSQQVGTPHEVFESDLVDLNSGSLKPIGPPNSTPAPGPWAWLADGSLLLEVRAFSAGANPGTYLVKPDGTSTRISTGQPFGLLP